MSQHDNTPDNEGSPEEQLRKMLEGMFGGEIDPQALASAAGLPGDPALIQQMMQQLQQAMSGTPGEINWPVATEQATKVASGRQVPLSDQERRDVDSAFTIAAMWLSEATDLSDPAQLGTVMNRTEWVTGSMPFWQNIAKPVATSISSALVATLEEQAPEEMSGMIAGAKNMITGVGGTLFAMQLGQVVGQLSSEVLSATEIGVPIFDENPCTLLPQNVSEFAKDLEIDSEQVYIFLATRELAHNALFRRAKWLSLDLASAVTDYAAGISIDTDRIEQIASEFDPTNTEQLQQAMRDGSLIPPKSESQKQALSRIETLLAVIEGWVDLVTRKANSRLPKAVQLSEMYNRRRATGGPAEAAFGALIGLELRPRRVREAAAMWQQIDAAVGAEKRDQLWQHPDILPTGDDIDDPAELIGRLQDTNPQKSDFDLDLERLLAGEFDDPASKGQQDQPENEPE